MHQQALVDASAALRPEAVSGEFATSVYKGLKVVSTSEVQQKEMDDKADGTQFKWYLALQHCFVLIWIRLQVSGLNEVAQKGWVEFMFALQQTMAFKVSVRHAVHISVFIHYFTEFILDINIIPMIYMNIYFCHYTYFAGCQVQ